MTLAVGQLLGEEDEGRERILFKTYKEKHSLKHFTFDLTSKKKKPNDNTSLCITRQHSILVDFSGLYNDL
jgi:hypothetical protein